ncbi:MAG: T9SS type A sorting domain-containing protein [Candidatus Cloacimonadota bacterium]|nr:MAG: T9SS type A sorting domain-containing protein [Candidatus Cloacimonadota bacterium]
MVKKSILFIILLTLFASVVGADNLTLEFTYRNYPEKIAQGLREKIENASSDELLPVIVEFDKLIDTGFLYNLVKGMGKGERRSFTINTLKEFTATYQKDVMGYLEEMENSGKVERLSQLWLTNSIGMKATKEIIEEVAKHSNVALIWLDDKHLKPHVVTGSEFSGNDNTPESRAIVWNVLKINADQVWGLGYTGENIIVGHIDTGVNYNHNDLKDHLWDGGPSYPNHGWDFENNDNDPMDDYGHGTHTAGTIAGDGTAGTQTGVAPDAQIMILKALGPMSTLQSAVNFALTQGAHVLTMSAGWDSSIVGGQWNSYSTMARNIVVNCMTAGVVFSTSAGNGKQPGHYVIPYDIGIPANTPAPWYGSASHSACMAVGATNQNNTIASFSSRGATQWWFSPWYEYSYPPGLIKPDVVAPGGSPGITSLSYTNNNGYVGGISWQGTSMSCPHLTGLITLILEKDPNLTPEELDSIIEITCLDLGSAGRDNYYGAGLINAFDAVNAVGIEEEPSKKVIPGQYSVRCYPNPARGVASIRFTLPRKAEISIDVYDVSGRKVSTVAYGRFESGKHDILWNRKNEKGVRVPQGVYFIRLRTGRAEAHGKLILIN